MVAHYAELNIMGDLRGFLALNSVSTANVEMKAILGSHWPAMWMDSGFFLHNHLY
jgi:hypothetical protein